MSAVGDLRGDLVAEQAALEAVLAGLRDDQWRTETPSPGWSVADQVGHLTFFDGTAALAITDPDGFSAGVAALIEAAGTVGIDEYTLGGFRAVEPSEILELWRMNRRRLDEAAATLAEDARVAWYGPSMGARSFLTARLMEVWAHGTDIIDAVGGERPATDRLAHIARLGVNTRTWSYRVRGREAPSDEVRVELVGPRGDTWSYGPESATERVTGPAEEFCLVVTQRRHLDDTSLRATPGAREWLLIAQAFAGGPTDPPAPGSRP